jgi:hypothetical protein
MKRTIGLILALAVGLTVRAVVITSIDNKTDFDNFAASVNDGDDYTGVTVTLNADINLNNEDWIPIGTPQRSFKGTFDGQNHKVSNLRVNIEAQPDYNVAGLFGEIGYGGVVKDLLVESGMVNIYKYINPNFTNNPELYPDYNPDYSPDGDPDYIQYYGYYTMDCYVGAIAGANRGGTIVGCANRGVTVYATCCYVKLGGIVGINTGNVENCYNLGNVQTSGLQTFRPDYPPLTHDDYIRYKEIYIGGIVGNNHFNGAIRNCFVRAMMDYYDIVAADHPIISENEGGAFTGCFYIPQGPDDKIFWSNLPIKCLSNSADNNETISDLALSGLEQLVLINGRTFYTDQTWNTICFPFDIPSPGKGRSPIARARVMEVDTEELYNYNGTGHRYGDFDENNILYINFKDAESIEAGKPYIVKWDDEIANNLSSPLFLGVKVNDNPVERILSYNGTIDFVGCYAPVNISGEDKHILYLQGNNKLYYPNAPMDINPFRAYFNLHGLIAGDTSDPNDTDNLDAPDGSSANLRAFVLKENDEGDPTGIVEMVNGQWSNGQMVNGKWSNGKFSDGWYDLSGRRLNGKPSTPGLYINNGKKIIIK